MNTEHFKQKLLAEKEQLLANIRDLGGRQDPLTKDWDATPVAAPENEPDEVDAADRFEEYEEKTAEIDTFEKRLIDVNDALAKIEAGVYGVCEISGDQIEIERLEANPAARTTIAHREEM